MALPFNYSYKQSPNYTKGRRAPISFIVLHWMVGNLAGTTSRFLNDAANVSAHYGVEDDNVTQYVDEDDTAWHAGNGAANSAGIGIEISAAPGRVPSDKTYESVSELVAAICIERKLNIDTALKPHSLYVATRCPGTDPSGNIRETGGVDFNRVRTLAKAIISKGGATPTPPAPKPAPKPAAPVKKSVDNVAQEVIYGHWGTGVDRINRLKAAGYDANAVQAAVNQKLGAGKPARKSDDQVAREVIAGQWGNGQDRFSRLRAAGFDAKRIQTRVNQLLR